jgi:carboxypeptidase Taq
MTLVDIEKLNIRTKEISHLASALSLLEWDTQVYMPEKGSGGRSETTSLLRTLVHQRFMEIDADGLLSELKKKLDNGDLGGKEAAIVREVWRDFERERKLPEAFVKELAQTTSRAHKVWEKARKESDFGTFQPYLEKIVELKRKEADLVGYGDSPYDALLDVFEPGMDAKETGRILGELKDFAVPFLEKIKQAEVSIDEKKILGDFPIEKQKEFNEFIAQKMSFDLEAGRMDVSTHPFTINFHPQDVRITTRYSIEDIMYSIGSTIHEAGHALYEQGLPHEHFGTPLAEYISLGIHESQSRVWENQIGKSKEFWQYFYPELQSRFPNPFKDLELDEFYRIINKVEPSLIRVESDELTYNLHIILRFEIEKQMIEGDLKISDLPDIWNQKVKDYLGIDVPNDREGILQDVHWSGGSIGYFPTYSLGNLYSAQFYNQAQKELPDLSGEVSKGELAPLREWLREKIHIHGKQFTASGLVKEVTGEELNPNYYTQYLQEKFSSIYGL